MTKQTVTIVHVSRSAVALKASPWSEMGRMFTFADLRMLLAFMTAVATLAL